MAWEAVHLVELLDLGLCRLWLVLNVEVAILKIRLFQSVSVRQQRIRCQRASKNTHNIGDLVVILALLTSGTSALHELVRLGELS